MSKDVTYIPVHIEIAQQIRDLDFSRLDVDGCSKCCDLLSILNRILKGCQADTLKTGSILSSNKAITLGRLEFGQFPECSECESCQTLPRYKEFYGKYLEQWTHVQQKYADAQSHQLMSQFWDHENKTFKVLLRREMDRVEILRKHLLLSNSSYSGSQALAKEEEMLVRKYRSKHTDDDMKFDSEFKNIIEEKENQIKALAPGRIKLEERLSTQMNLYLKDVVVSDLRKSIDKLMQQISDLEKESNAKDITIEELQQ